MSHKRLKSSTILLLGFGLTGQQAQTICMKESSVRKIPFSGTIQLAEGLIVDRPVEAVLSR